MIGFIASALAQVVTRSGVSSLKWIQGIQECPFFPIPVRAESKLSLTSSTVSVVNSGTPKTLMRLLPATGLFASLPLKRDLFD